MDPLRNPRAAATSGLLITAAPGTDVMELAALLDLDPRITCGDPVDSFVPAVAETAPGRAGRAVVDSISARPGVAHVDVVFVETAVDRGPAEANEDQ